MASFSNITNIALGTVIVIVTGVVGLIVLAALAPTYLSSLGDLAAVFASTADANSTGTAAGDALKVAMAPIISIGGVIALIALAFGVLVLEIRRRRGGSME